MGPCLPGRQGTTHLRDLNVQVLTCFGSARMHIPEIPRTLPAGRQARDDR